MIDSSEALSLALGKEFEFSQLRYVTVSVSLYRAIEITVGDHRAVSPLVWV